MGKGWRSEQGWPLARQRETAWYFAPEGALSTEAPAPAVQEYQVDLSADSRSDGANRWNYRLAAAKSVMRFGADNGKRLEFSTGPLDEDTEVTGHPAVTLALSSDAPTADVFVYLVDVTPAGERLPVTEGQLRANYPGLHPVQQITASDASEIAVKPELPWHGYSAKDYVKDPLRDGKTVELTLDLLPTSWVFKQGHRIAVFIAGADNPSFAVHPDLGGEDAAPPTLFLHLGQVSKIVLPVIP